MAYTMTYSPTILEADEVIGTLHNTPGAAVAAVGWPVGECEGGGEGTFKPPPRHGELCCGWPGGYSLARNLSTHVGGLKRMRETD